MTIPKVSVLMSVYNSREYLEDSIRSILIQDFSDFEFLIVDDGSTDGSSEILSQVNDPRVKVIRQENRGLTQALNRGIDECTGDYIARQDADDLSAPNRLSTLVAAIQPKVKFYVSGWNRMHQSISRPSRTSTLLGWFPDYLRQRLVEFDNLYVHGTFFFEKKFVQSLGKFRPLFQQTQDYDLLLRVLDQHPIRFIPDALYTLRLHSDSISALRRQNQTDLKHLAALFSKERHQTGGGDSYTRLQTETPKEIRQDLEKKFPIFDKTSLLLEQVRGLFQ